MSLSSQPLVSVVTPFYNEEKYLAQCIESVQNQTYENWEYILVNNCSSDRSLQIAQNYAAKDSRLKIYNNRRFLGQLQNFNHAVRQISNESKYCKMILGDDWLFPECLTEMVKVSEANPSVGIVGSYRLNGVRVDCDGLPYPSTIVKGRDICRLVLMGGPFVFGSPSSLLVRSDIFRNRDPVFNELSLHADTELCYEVLQNHDFGYVHQVLSFVRVDNVSISLSSRGYNPDLLDNFISMKMFGQLYLNNEEYTKHFRRRKNRYFKFLGESVLTVRDTKFWSYHKNGLQTIGYHLNFYELWKYVGWALIDIIFNPKKTVGRLIR